MELQEINDKIVEWVREGNENNRSVIFIALEKDEKSQDEEKRAGETVVQLAGKRFNLIQSVVEALRKAPMPLKQILVKAFEIDIKLSILGDGLLNEFNEFINEKKGRNK